MSLNNNLKKLEPKIWLTNLFFTLETIAIYYPNNPNKVTIKKYYHLIQNLPVFIPVAPMGSYFLSLLDKYPVQPYLNSRTSFMKWVFFIKKKIYKKLKMEVFDFYENLEIYYNAYKPKELIDNEKYKEKKKYIQSFFVLMISLSIYYFYNK
tara:strand:+ start:1150 stop:1602 length:453 start_codon:yes stop_codon:yes gene_type:complete